MTGSKITITVVYVSEGGLGGHIAFTTYSGSELRAPGKRVFRVSRRTHPRRNRPIDPQTALELLKQTVRKEARRRGITHVINLD